MRAALPKHQPRPYKPAWTPIIPGLELLTDTHFVRTLHKTPKAMFTLRLKSRGTEGGIPSAKCRHLKGFAIHIPPTAESPGHIATLRIGLTTGNNPEDSCFKLITYIGLLLILELHNHRRFHRGKRQDREALFDDIDHILTFARAAREFSARKNFGASATVIPSFMSPRNYRFSRSSICLPNQRLLINSRRMRQMLLGQIASPSRQDMRRHLYCCLRQYPLG